VSGVRTAALVLAGTALVAIVAAALASGAVTVEPSVRAKSVVVLAIVAVVTGVARLRRAR
jgi:uncharacterized membrane protein YhiD involved in acid resistance